jgi:F0F1-type ATP synthase assembly protein I
MARTMTLERFSQSYQQDKTDWSATLWAGIIAGVVFLIAEMLMVMLFLGESPWGPPLMIAAMLLGRDVLPPPADFNASIVFVAMAIHFVLSVALGLALGWVVHRMNGTSALLIGIAFGLAVYFINFYLIAPIAFPWFVQAQNWVSLVSHALFGLALGGSYAALRKHKPALESPAAKP